MNTRFPLVGVRVVLTICAVATALVRVDAQAPTLQALANTLRQGGYTLVMRHATSPREAPTKDTANSDNPKLERQLDDAGRRGATAMGDALRALGIPIGTVLASPTYRAMETVKFARLGSPTTVAELGDGGQSMQGVTDAQAGSLRTRVTEVPRSGNTILVTHQPNLSRAFPDWGPTVADGETVVLQPDGKGGITLIGRIPIDEWPKLRR